MRVFSLRVLAVVLLGMIAPATTSGAVLCARKRGAVVVLRDGAECRRREQPLDPSALGLQGPPGSKGDAGGRGERGERGEPGPFPTGDLPSGATLRGVFFVAGTDTAATAARSGSTISFVFPLAQAPEPHYVVEGALPITECPGTAAAPAALPGHLCVYEGSASNASNVSIGDPVSGIGPGTSRFGATISAVGDFESNFGISGTWAVTAP